MGTKLTRKEVEMLMKQFRAKCSELNLVNDEFAAMEIERKHRYDEYQALYTAYHNWHAKTMQPLGHQLNEIRSELQALQAQLLDVMIDEWIGQW